MKLALRGEFVPDAVNVQAAGPVVRRAAAVDPAGSRLGTILTAVAGAVPSQVVVEVRGDLAAQDTSILQLAAVRGIFGGVITEAVTFVNAPALAAEHGLGSDRHVHEETGDYRSSVTVRAAMADGETRTVSGTLSGKNQVAKLIEINSRHFDLRAEGNLLVVAYADRPGVMGTRRRAAGRAGDQHRGRADLPGTRRPRRRSWCCGWTGCRLRTSWSGSARRWPLQPFGAFRPAEPYPPSGSAPWTDTLTRAATGSPRNRVFEHVTPASGRTSTADHPWSAPRTARQRGQP